MSCCSITNTVRVVGVNQALQINGREVADQARPHGMSASLGLKPASTVLPETIIAKGVGDDSAAMGALIALFTSFFNRLIKLISDQKEKTVPLVPPKPPLRPRVLPTPPSTSPTRSAPPASIPGLSSKRGGAKPDNIWNGFRQGPDGNCVTVSAIKAAMHKFGQSPTDIYKDVRRENNGYRVTMRDEVVVILSDQELQQGAHGSQFVGPDKGMLKDAQFLYAVSAKRAQMENNDGFAASSFNAAIRSLNDREDESGPGEGFLRLGLRRHMRTVGVQELAKGQIGMCNRAGHSVAVINGREELWGRQGGAPTRGDAIALV